jgi:hypothetical protein
MRVAGSVVRGQLMGQQLHVVLGDLDTLGD